MFARIERLPVPVRLKTIDDLVHLVSVVGDHGVVTGLGQVLGLPVEGFHERCPVIYHHRLLMSEVKRRITVKDLDPRLAESFAGFLILGFATAAGRVQHHSHLDPAMLRFDHRLQ